MTATVPAPGQQLGQVGTVARLGVFSPTRYSNSVALEHCALAPLVGGLAPELRQQVAQYLRSGTVVLHHGDYTTDVLEYRFGVPAGASVLTDGVFYWRKDAAEYVQIYGTVLDSTAIDQMRQSNWLAPVVAPEIARQIESFLARELAGPLRW